jgi:hypothetical protein
MRDGNEVALVATFAAVIGPFSSATRARRRGPRLAATSASARVERASVSVGLGLAVGMAPVADLHPRRMAWFTVVQRMLPCADSFELAGLM